MFPSSSVMANDIVLYKIEWFTLLCTPSQKRSDLKKIILILLTLSICGLAQAQQQASNKNHYVCFQSTDIYHDKTSCSTLQFCSGGKIRKTKNIEGLKPCKKCARPQISYRASGFSDIKKVLGVKDKKQIPDSLGTSEATIKRPGDLFIRISGPPDSRTVNLIEFYFNKPVAFNEDSLFSNAFYSRLGLQMKGCKSDTIRNNTPHPVTGKIKQDVSIEYRGCAIVEPRDQYEDVSKYYYELTFVAKEGPGSTELEKIQLYLKAERN